MELTELTLSREKLGDRLPFTEPKISSEKNILLVMFFYCSSDLQSEGTSGLKIRRQVRILLGTH